MKYIFIFIFLFTLSCSFNKVKNNHGTTSLDTKYKKLYVNKSNSNDIINIFGPPSTKSNFDEKIWFYIGVQISSAYGAFYAIWHVGIENKILSGPAECARGLQLSKNVSKLKDQIMSKPIVNCEEVVWSFFGISAASINSIILLLIFVLNAIYIFQNYTSKKI